jgi:hypothetical protein
MTMNKAEVLEEIRTLLREPQVETVENPWNYGDLDLSPQVRSALRNMRTMGLAALDGVTYGGDPEEFSRPLTEPEGMMLSLFVAHRLLAGDLVQKLLEGELGIYLNAGGDVIDTKTATRAFREVADHYHARLESMIAVAVANDPQSSAAALYGGPKPYMA